MLIFEIVRSLILLDHESVFESQNEIDTIDMNSNIEINEISQFASNHASIAVYDSDVAGTIEPVEVIEQLDDEGEHFLEHLVNF